MNPVDINTFLEEVVKCYSECPRSLELYDNYVGADLDYVKSDMRMKLASYSDYTCFLVEINNEIIGYFAKGLIEGKPCLITFFVKPDHRNKKTITEYMNTIKKTFKGEDFIAGVYTSNDPANKFLTKNGERIIMNETVSYYIIKGDISCQ